MRTRVTLTVACTTTTHATPHGWRYIPEFLSRAKEADLMEHLAPLDWDGNGLIRRRGQIVKRREVDFYLPYNRITQGLGEPLTPPGFLTSIRHQCAAAVGIEGEKFQQAIASLYRPGAGIDWHVDSEDAFGEYVCGLSLGSSCVMQLRPVGGAGTISLELQPRSLYILQGGARWAYQHRIRAV
jgi:alkylated DNA repair dioxygenase AlkB